MHVMEQVRREAVKASGPSLAAAAVLSGALQKTQSLVERRKREMDDIAAEHGGQEDPGWLARLNAARDLWLLAQRQHDREREREADRAQAAQAQAVADHVKLARTPPDLQALVQRHGTWDKITPEAWKQFDFEMAQWRSRLAGGDLTQAAFARRNYQERR